MIPTTLSLVLLLIAFALLALYGFVLILWVVLILLGIIGGF